jgi:transposase
VCELHPKSWTQNPTERGAVFMTKYRKEDRIAAIKAVEAGESINQAAKQYHMSRAVLQLSIRNYQEHGENGLSTHEYGWTAKQKYELLKHMHENQISFLETSVLFGIRDSTIWNWEKRYLENGIEGLENKKKGRKPRVVKPKLPKTREEELLERIEDLEIENEYLKKLNALVAEREKREKGIK